MLSLCYDAFCLSQRRAIFWEGERAWRAMKHVPRFLGRTAGLASNETHFRFLYQTYFFLLYLPNGEICSVLHTVLFDVRKEF